MSVNDTVDVVVGQFRNEGYLAYRVSKAKGRLIVIKPSRKKSISMKYNVMKDTKLQRVIEKIVISMGLEQDYYYRRIDFGVVLLTVQ